jgi:hypothetical protein
MTALSASRGTQSSDAQTVKRWAAEDVAIAMGLLRECPYHGQPFKTQRKPLASNAVAVGLIDPLDPSVQVFNGNTRELLNAVERVTHDYGDRCDMCAASEQDDYD